MHGGPSHITAILALEGAGTGAVHDTRVVPGNQVARVLPLHLEDILGLLGVGIQGLEEMAALGVGQALDVVDVRGDVQVGAAGGFVPLYEPMPTERVVLRHDVSEEIRRRALAAVPETVRRHVVVLQELCFQSRV